MTTPSPRNPVRPARGYYAWLLADQANLPEGELFYVQDQNTLYVKEGGALVPIVGTGTVATNSVKAGDNVSKLVNDAGYLTLSTLPADRVQSVNGQIGIVVIDADDIPTTGTVNKFTTTEEINKLAGIEVGAQVNEVEEAPQDGNYYVRQNSAWVPNTSVPVDISNNTLGELSDVNASSPAAGEALIYNGSAWAPGGDFSGGSF